MSVHKDATIRRLLHRLDLARRRWIVVDHWEADLCAVGVAAVANPSRLVYVSTYGKAKGRFDYECEVGSEGAPDDYTGAGRGQDVAFDELVTVMEAHLG